MSTQGSDELDRGLWPYGGIPAPKSLVAPSILMIVLMPICLGLRLWSVGLSKERLGLPVLCVGLAFICAVPYLAIGIYETEIPPPKDASDFMDSYFDSELYVKAKTLVTAGSVFNIVSAALAKLYLVFLYRTIFPTKLIRWATIVLGAFVILWTTSVIVLQALECSPQSAAWTPGDDEPGSHWSVSETRLFAFTTIPNVIADIVLLVLPIREVLKLQMSSKTKVQVSAIFVLGSITTIVAIIRLALILTPSTFINGVPLGPADLGLSIICACTPGMGPAITKILSPSKTTRPHEPVFTDHPRIARRPPPSYSRLSRTSLPTPTSSASIPSRLLTKLESAIGWQPMPIINHYPIPTIHKQNRNSEEMEEFRRLYEYSGNNPFSQDAYARMTDTELWGGIRVEQTVAMRVEPNLEMDVEAAEGGVQMPAGVHYGGGGG